MKILLTDRALKAMKPAANVVVWDSSVPGFGVRVGKSGKLSFIVMRRLAGQKNPSRWPLGTYPIMSLAEAREKALEALREIGAGIDPKAKEETARRAQNALQQEEARRQANTFATVVEEFITKHVRNLRSAADVEATIRRELLPRWGGKLVAEISRRDVVTAIEDVAGSGRLHLAHHAFSYTSKFFGWAIARDIGGLEVSPCAGIKRSDIIPARAARQRVLNDDEIRLVWQASEGLGYPAAPFVRLLLLTGQRLREVAEMTWPELDLAQGLWTIPANRMKAAAAHEIPFAPAAADILRGLPRWPGPYVFSTTSGKRPISGFSKMKLRLDAAMPEPILAWRFHDIRRTMRTGLGSLPVPSIVAELCIGHTQQGLHKVYDLHSYRDEKRRAFELWAARVASIVEPQENGKIMRLKA